MNVNAQMLEQCCPRRSYILVVVAFTVWSCPASETFYRRLMNLSRMVLDAQLFGISVSSMIPFLQSEMLYAYISVFELAICESRFVHL